METRRESSPVHFVLTLAIMVVVLALARAAWPQTPPLANTVRGAIAQAVAGRIGGGALVTVTALATAIEDGPSLAASPEPGARTSAPARFVIWNGPTRVGTAVATVHVSARHLRARHELTRDAELAAADLEEVTAPLRDQPIKRVPALAQVVGARVRRRVAAGEAITSAVVRVEPLVRSGDKVAIVVRIGAVEAEGRGVASGSGQAGDVIRVMSAGTRRPMKARITGPGAVEIIQ